jgi:hypothetical protein
MQSNKDAAASFAASFFILSSLAAASSLSLGVSSKNTFPNTAKPPPINAMAKPQAKRAATVPIAKPEGRSEANRIGALSSSLFTRNSSCSDGTLEWVDFTFLEVGVTLKLCVSVSSSIRFQRNCILLFGSFVPFIICKSTTSFTRARCRLPLGVRHVYVCQSPSNHNLRKEKHNNGVSRQHSNRVVVV